MPSLPPLLRRAPRLALVALLAGGALALTGCEQVAIIKSAPAAATYDQRYGNDTLAAFDASSLETALRQRSQVWSMRFDLQPASAGDVKVTSQQDVLKGRAAVRDLTLTLIASVPATLQGFSAQGAQGEQAYLEQLVQIIANAGYTGLHGIRVEVWYQGSHHATLTWSAKTSFVYKVLDGKP